MAVSSFIASTATAPGCTLSNVKSVTIDDTVQTLEIFADGADQPTIFPWGRKQLITIECGSVAGSAGKTGAVTIGTTARAGSLPAPGAAAAPSFSGNGVVLNVKNSAPQVDGGMSSGTVTIVCTASLPA